MFCTTCGSPIANDHAFCSGCGRAVAKRLTSTGESVSTVTTGYARPFAPDDTERSRPSPPPPPPPSNIYVTQQVQVAQPVVRAGKSVGLAVVLGLLFGPFGLFYASVTGGIIMLIGGFMISAVTVGAAAPLVWIACAVWAGIAASNYNNAIAATAYASSTQISR